MLVTETVSFFEALSHCPVCFDDKRQYAMDSFY